jgi:hypothetical protein
MDDHRLLRLALVGWTPQMSLERYWQAFSSDHSQVSGAVVFKNRDLPILEVNAGYPNAPGQILEIKRFYAARGRPACLILSESSNLELEASNAQFVPHAGIAVLECEPELEPDWTKMTLVEQVSWGAARSLAKTWCDQVGARGWEINVSSEIARLMPNHPNILGYLALEKDRVIGMGFALEGSIHWLAGESKTKMSIIKRAAFDSGIPFQFSIALEQIPEFPLMRELERFVIWTETSLR